jgi:hypothetical protein
MLKNEICSEEPTILWNRRKGDEKLDWLAEEILCTLQDLGFDAEHLESKRCDLSGKDRYEVLRWCGFLDDHCLTALVARLNISVDDMRTTIKTVWRI